RDLAAPEVSEAFDPLARDPKRERGDRDHLPERVSALERADRMIAPQSGDVPPGVDLGDVEMPNDVVEARPPGAAAPVPNEGQDLELRSHFRLRPSVPLCYSTRRNGDQAPPGARDPLPGSADPNHRPALRALYR